MTTPPEDWPEIAGRIAHGMHVLPVRVYYEDTDFSGAVYHANYLKFCERARSDALRLLGIHHRELMGKLGFVVRAIACDYLKPCGIDDMLLVETRFIEIGGARLEIDQRIRRDGETIFTAKVTVAVVDAQGRPRRIPDDMRRSMAMLKDRQT
jgi:acyl-CoA thioester hydrolase